MISIILPIYNAEIFLEDMLDSVLRQTYQNIELLLIDDGSTDRSGSICDQYAAKDCRIRVFHTKNQGVCRARNLGLSYAEGEYIEFVDADDLVNPYLLEIQLDLLKKTQADLCICGFQSFNTQRDGKLPVLTKDTCVSAVNYEIYTPHHILQGMLSGSLQHSWAPWGKLFLRKLFSDIRFPEDISFGEDQVVFYEYLFRSSRIVYVEEALYYYREEIVNSSTSRNFAGKALTLCKSWEYVFALVEQKAPALRKLAKQEYYAQFYYVLHRYVQLGNSMEEEAYRIIRSIVRTGVFTLLSKKNFPKKEKLLLLCFCLNEHIYFRLVNSRNLSGQTQQKS